MGSFEGYFGDRIDKTLVRDCVLEPGEGTEEGGGIK